MQPVGKGDQRLHETLVVDLRRLGQELVHRLPPRQVEISRDRAELQVEIEEAHPRRRGLVDIGELPGEVDGQRARPGAAGEPVHRHHDRAMPAGRAGSAALTGGGGGLDRPCEAGHRGLQLALGQGVGNERLGPEAQQPVQRGRANVLRDEDHLDPEAPGGGDDGAHGVEIVRVLRIDGDGQMLQMRRLGLAEESRGLGEVEIAPGLGEHLVHVVDQQVERLDVARDGARPQRLGVVDRMSRRKLVCHAPPIGRDRYQFGNARPPRAPRRARRARGGRDRGPTLPGRAV